MFKLVKIRIFFLSLVALFGTLTLVAQNQDISDTQLAQFADAYMTVQTQNQEAQQEMIAVIEKEGLEVERFSEIQEASLNPNQESDATPEEMKKHAKAIEKIDAMQPEFEKKAIEGIEKSGISMEEYQNIASAVQQDQKLQQKLQTILMERTAQ